MATTIVGKLDAIVYEIHQDLAQACGITHEHAGHVGGHHVHELHILLRCEGKEDLAHVFHYSVHGERLYLQLYLPCLVSPGHGLEKYRVSASIDNVNQLPFDWKI